MIVLGPEQLRYCKLDGSQFPATCPGIGVEDSGSGDVAVDDLASGTESQWIVVSSGDQGVQRVMSPNAQQTWQDLALLQVNLPQEYVVKVGLSGEVGWAVFESGVVSTFDVVTGELIESVDLEDAPIPIDMVATPSGAYFATPGLGVTFMQLMCM